MSLEFFLQNIIFDASLAAAAVLFYLFNKKKPVKELFLEKPKSMRRELKNTLVLTGALVLASIAIGLLLYPFGLNDSAKAIEKIAEVKEMGLFFLIYLFTVRVAVEEVFFRGLLTRKTGVIISSIIFGLSHFAYGSAIELIGATALGAILAIAFNKNRSIYSNILAHSAYNFITLAMAGLI
ncbi:MAG: CPBP family intramembrane glutamic endopeptidase [Candidatus Diapherotrites archaeon]